MKKPDLDMDVVDAYVNLYIAIKRLWERYGDEAARNQIERHRNGMLDWIRNYKNGRKGRQA